MYLERTAESYLKKAARQFPVLLVTGARQVGKSTLLKHAAGKTREYITLDDPLVLRLAKEDPALFLQRYRPPISIDEIQYAPELLPHIKMEADAAGKAGLFWLTGSQQFHLMKGVSESLAGRVGIIELLGFSRREITGQAKLSRPFIPSMKTGATSTAPSKPPSLKEIYKGIWRGSFPAIASNSKINRDLFFSSYAQTYLQRDIHDLARVGDEMTFLRFLRAVAARTAQMLNLADLARDAGISPNTARSWLSILQASGIVHLLEPYFSNVTKRLVKAPKLYFLDTGLCAYLTEWSSPETLEAGAMSGAILETAVIAELLKSYQHNGRRAPFYYYRDKDGKEIDLLIVQDGSVYPVEIKKTASPGKDAARRFSVVGNLGLKPGPGCVICLVTQTTPISKDVTAIPLSSI